MQRIAVGLAVLVAISAAASASASATGGYGGMGATVRAFNTQNPHGKGRPPVGIAYFDITHTKRGRVTSYEIETNFKPRPGARERVSLGGGINVPADATMTNLNSTYCIVWHSKKLGRMIGKSYVASTTTKYTPTIAEVRAERKPAC